MPPAPQSGQLPVPGAANMMPPAPRSGQLPAPHVYGLPPGPPPPGPQPPGPIPFVASGPTHSTTVIPPQQPYAQPYNPGAYQQAQQQPHPAPFIPPPQSFNPDPMWGPAPASGYYPGLGMPLNPLGLMAAGNIFGGGQSWGQQYVERMQQRVGYFTGGALHFHFAISKQYVLSKLLMLIAPYLRRWTYTRQPEQMQGGSAFKPPREDTNCPDLYIPLMGLWTYTLMCCGVQATRGKFKPDNVYPLAWSASVAWLMHLLLAKAVLRAMALPASVPWVELAAYTGYSFVPVCLSIAVGQLGGRWAYWGAWAYGSLCMAIFLVRTMKRVIFQETRGYGRDLTLVNYLLLGLALFQFPYAFYLGVRP
ncbi:hypothetical protein VOLCADRAFT_104419 [Volvox carteri f. nagariensis]|uniref:Uncharacterized protein n=1 Tax=Volvox carteri f. nagariensis TaxID=3068 RepID=D8TTI0_VOLCA|nr:uncharacterized protein VOLCADRAFT_104419 [Volvox carteri f. nagariensis]EFJ49310.1 hypothetical protein VOLCADRAFT_104419 [Volvox carteri f. nagariensis]|eukprot:XP_002949758.1 hypothetical protein VOLCADRAFT_104419 [Volvox carteri f. nagariensis]